jgi:hypothetical protein
MTKKKIALAIVFSLIAIVGIVGLTEMLQGYNLFDKIEEQFFCFIKGFSQAYRP